MTEPKNETARISSLPASPARSAEGVPAVPLVATARPVDGFDAIPATLGWGLFGIASVNFLIQIWIYVVS
jgi:hypothetical protein